MAIPAVLFVSSAVDRRGGDGPAGGDAGRPVLVHDLACDGFSLEAALGLPANATIAIDLPGTNRRMAEVTGLREGLSRCRFTEPLPPALLPRILAAAPGRGGGALPEPHVRKWPPAIRIALLLGLALLLWTTVLRFLR